MQYRPGHHQFFDSEKQVQEWDQHHKRHQRECNNHDVRDDIKHGMHPVGFDVGKYPEEFLHFKLFPLSDNIDAGIIFWSDAF